MTKFIQIHILTPYPLSNLNRDDLGRPKTAFLGGTERGRISSQCLKRTWRLSETFEKWALGTRTKVAGLQIHEELVAEGLDSEKVVKALQPLLEVFGGLVKSSKNKKEVPLVHSQMVFLNPSEIDAIKNLARTLVTEEREVTSSEISSLKNLATNVDVAMFGRMMANDNNLNVEAAVQVAHAITVHATKIETDYFTAVDDLTEDQELLGSGHIGERGMTSGVFYSYISVDIQDLIKNLGGNDALAVQAIQALVKAALTVTPTGMQNSFASRTYAGYCQIEKGSAQPCSMATAFLTALPQKVSLEEAANVLEDYQMKLHRAYGTDNVSKTLNVLKGEGSVQELLDFIAG